MKKYYQIAIDGPGGAGKTTIAKEIAKRLDFLFINTGGMYRCYAIALRDTNLDDHEAVMKVLSENVVSLTPTELFLNGENVTGLANSPAISELASKIGTMRIVREKCVRDQQKIAEGQNVVMEGRDTTSVVLPNATLKVFLTASLYERAKRRWLQYNQKEDIKVIEADLAARDFQDSNRDIAPLQQTPDAVRIDSDSKSIEDIIEIIISEFKRREEISD